MKKILYEAMWDCCARQIYDEDDPWVNVVDPTEGDEDEDAVVSTTTPAYAGASIGPGAIDYFARQLFVGTEKAPCQPEEVHSYNRLLVGALSKGLGPSRPSEVDIKSLTELIVRSSREGCSGNLAIRECLRHQYSSDLVLFLCDRLSFGSYFNTHRILGRPRRNGNGHPQLRQAVDQVFLFGIQQLSFRVHQMDILETYWTEESFMRCLLTLLQSTGLVTEMALEVPHRFVGDKLSFGTEIDTHGQSPVLSSLLTAMNGNHGLAHFDSREVAQTGIRKLCLRFKGDNYETPHSHISWLGNYAALKLPFCMPHLRVLNLELWTWPLEFVAPHLVEAISTLRLKSLSIEVRPTPKHELVVSLLEALRANSSIFEFSYKQTTGIEPQYYELYDQVLFEVLGHNATLQNATVDTSHGPTRPEMDERIIYYLALNRYGRSMARTGWTELLMLLLPSASWEIENLARPPLSYGALDIVYGLLRELPGSWSIQAVRA